MKATVRVAKVAPVAVLLSALHAAVYLDMPYTSFRRLAASHAFPVVIISKRVYVRKVDLDAYITSNLEHAWISHGSEKQKAAQAARRERERNESAA